MSGAEENLHADWKNKLASHRVNFPGTVDEGEIGGFKANRKNRRKTSSAERVVDPFGEIVVKARRRDRSDQSEDARRGAETLFQKDPEDIGGNVTENAIGEEEVPIMSQNQDPPLSDENHERVNSSTRRSNRTNAEGEDQHAEYQPTPEEIEADRKRELTNATIKKAVKMSILSIGTLAVVAGGAAICAGLFGKHKSNIMNL